MLVGRSLLLEQAKRLGGRAGLPWLVFSGPETGSRVHVPVGDRVEDLGPFSLEVVLGAIARGIGVERLRLERRAENWIEAMMVARFGVTSPVVQTETVP